MNEKKLFLLDGHALVYRAHFAFITRPLINSKGLNTSAINGFTRMLWDLLRTEKPTHIAVAFDPHGPTFRHEQYPKYKANREEQPEDIGVAIPWIQKILKGFLRSGLGHSPSTGLYAGLNAIFELITQFNPLLTVPTTGWLLRWVKKYNPQG